MADTTALPANNDEEEERRQRQLREQEIERLLLEQDEAVDFEDASNQRPQQLGQGEAAEPVENIQQPPLEAVPLVPPPDVPQTEPKRLSYVQSSFLAALLLLVYAFRTRQHQWYLAAVYLSSSKLSLVIFGNALIALAVALFDITTGWFLQGLRLLEAEGLQDFFRWNVTETCLALTMFRSELTAVSMIQFLMLIWIKCCHQVAGLRNNHIRMTQEPLDTSGAWPVLPWSSVKLVTLLILLQFVDLWIVQYTTTDLLERGPSVNILFAFESAIALTSAWSHLLLFSLHVLDGYLHYGHERHMTVFSKLLHPWKEYKATLTFAVELQAQAGQFIFYLSFFGIVLTYYGMPINLFREVFMSFTALKERVSAFLKYRRLMASMDRFRNATDEQIEEAGRVCIICRDDMTPYDCKQLPVCNHLFHKSCLREWLVQQQSCPTCRSDITANEALEAVRTAAARAAQERDQQEDESPAAAEQEQSVPTENNETNSSQRNVTPDDLTAVEPDALFSVDEDRPSAAPHLDPVTRKSESPPPLTEEEDKNELQAIMRTEKPQTFQNMSQSEPPSSASPPQNVISFPALYRVVQESGALVWHEKDNSLVRVVPLGTVVVCLAVRGSDRAGFQLKIPDGWISDDDVLLVQDISSQVRVKNVAGTDSN